MVLKDSNMDFVNIAYIYIGNQDFYYTDFNINLVHFTKPIKNEKILSHFWRRAFLFSTKLLHLFSVP